MRNSFENYEIPGALSVSHYMPALNINSGGHSLKHIPENYNLQKPSFKQYQLY